MDKSAKQMDGEEEQIGALYAEVNPEGEAPNSLAEAPPAPLDYDDLGGTANQSDVNKK